jgi:nucleotide-binding universal stress UspA family protein
VTRIKRVQEILFASDFSGASRRAFTTAVALAQATRATLTIVHVIVPILPVVPEQYLGSLELDHLRARTREWSQRRLDALTAQAKRHGVEATSRLLEGDAAEQIVRAARSGRADLIVVGTHGRSGLSRLFLGSVAARLIATASRPVVTVRGR